MRAQPGSEPTRSPLAQQQRREDWLTDGIVSGFIATVVMTIVIFAAYNVARALGVSGASDLRGALWALTNNQVTELTSNQVVLAIAVNFAAGIFWALIYAFVVEPRLSGPGWRRGVLFSLVPWLLSIVVFLPLIGGGLFGGTIGAGILPVVGNLVLHLIFGATLGGFYAIALENGIENTELERRNAARAERGAAVGVAIGLVVGAGGGWLLAPTLASDFGIGAVMLAGALIGAAGGLAAGSFAGMGSAQSSSPPH